MGDLKTNLETVRSNIARSAEKVGRDPAEVKLVCVTKTVGIQEIEQLHDLGEEMFGESRVQDARRKIFQVPSLPAKWHLIGHLQTNKVKHALDLFQYIHSVDNLRLAKEISHRAEMLEISIPILIEVNVSGEASKFGTPLESHSPKSREGNPVLGIFDLIPEVVRLPGLSFRGLMAMAPFVEDAEEVRPVFRRLRELRDEINQLGLTPYPLTELSMGMTNDYKVAIEEGATFVRVGSALFE